MLTYVVLFFVLIVLWFVSLAINNKSLKILATAAVFFIIGFRDVTVGADTASYKLLYEANYNWGPNEVGYTWVTGFLNDAGVPFSTFLIMVAALCMISFYVFVNKYSDDYIFSLIMFVGIGNFAMFLTGVRQTIAISIVTLAFVAMMKNKWYLYFPLVLLASAFHYSALFCLPVYFAKKIKLSRGKITFASVTVWGILILFGGSVFQFFTKFFPEKYAEDLIESAGKYSVNILVIAIEICIFVFCWLSMSKSKDAEDGDVWGILMFFQIIVIGLQLAGTTSMQLLRLAYYFDIAKLVLLTKAISRYKNGDKLIIQFLIIVLVAAKFLMSTPGGYSQIDNYSFFFMS